MASIMPVSDTLGSPLRRGGAIQNLWNRRQPRAIPERLKDTLIPLLVT